MRDSVCIPAICGLALEVVPVNGCGLHMGSVVWWDTCTLRNVLPNHCVEGQHTVGFCWLNVNFLIVGACMCEYSFCVMKEKA